MKRYTVSQARRHFSELIAQAAAGEEIVIWQPGRPDVHVVPAKGRDGAKAEYLSPHA